MDQLRQDTWLGRINVKYGLAHQSAYRRFFGIRIMKNTHILTMTQLQVRAITSNINIKACLICLKKFNERLAYVLCVDNA